MKKAFLFTLASTASLFALTNTAHADESRIENLVEGGRAYVDARYRYEFVNDSNFAEDANASTIRTRVGVESGAYNGISALVEVENISSTGSEKYNDGGATASDANRPVVADPTVTELNQAYLSYTGIEDTRIKVGRQTINRMDQRFIGSVNWRQNDQTQDAATLYVDAIEDVELFYGYSLNVNRIFGHEDAAGSFNGNNHYLDAAYKGLDAGTFAAYAYLLDFESQFAANSSATYGARFFGDHPINDDVTALYHIEYATQSDMGENPNSYDADYYRAELGAKAYGITAKLGYEVLGSDNGTAAFQTPLSTLHKFNGWADQFLSTPTTGLEDSYAKLAYTLNNVHKHLDGTRIMLAYHMFEAESGGGDFGTEFNADISKKITKHVRTGVRYANYQADNGAFATNDVQKVIFSLGFTY